MNTFIGISRVDYESIEINRHALTDRILLELLPVAYDSGGNWWLLDCSDEQTRGAVYFVDLENAVEDEPPSRADMLFIAAKFGELIAILLRD